MSINKPMTMSGINGLLEGNGLDLLVGNMDFDGNSVCRYEELTNTHTTKTISPALLVLLFELDDNTSGSELVNHLRVAFSHPVPTILLSHESSFNTGRFLDEHTVVLLERIKGKDLCDKPTRS